MRMVEWKKLGEVCTYYRGVTYNKKQEVPLGTGGTKILRANNITLDSNTLNFEDIKEVSSDVKIKEYQWLNPNDILICAGSGSKEHVGKVAFIFEKIGYAYGGFMGKLVVSEGLQSRFLFHVISSHLFKKYLEVALNSTTINNLNAEIVNNFLIPVPSIAEQTRIVGILDTFTASIENLKQQIAQRRKQYEHYRDQLLDLEGKDGAVMKTLGDLCDYVDYRGKTPHKVEKGVFLVTAKNIRKGFIDYCNSKEYIAEEDYANVMRRGLPKIGDVLITTEAPCGNVAQIDNENVALAQRVIKYRPRDLSLNPSYLKFILLGEYFQTKLDKEATGGTVKGIKGSKLHKMTIPVPSLAEQQRIVSILDTFEDSIANLEQQLAQRERQYEYYRNKLLTFE